MIDSFLEESQKKVEMKQDMRSWRARFQCVATVENRVEPLKNSASALEIEVTKHNHKWAANLGAEIKKSQEEEMPSYAARKELSVVKKLTKLGKDVET